MINRVNFIKHLNKSETNNAQTNKTPAEAALSVEGNQLKIATFNLFNYLEPPNAYYEFERIYSAEQWIKKQRWITHYLSEHQPDIIGFQEVFSATSLKELVLSQGYSYFEVVDEPEIIDEFIYRKPVVAIASRYPIIKVAAVNPDTELAQQLGLTTHFSFSRKVLRATINVPQLGYCDCYVVHFKSKRPMLEFDTSQTTLSPEEIITQSLKAQIAGSWGSTIQRGSEAALLMIDIIARRVDTSYPAILMGDFNNKLTDGVLNHMLTHALPFASDADCDAYLSKYCLYDAWDLFNAVQLNEMIENSKSDLMTQPPSITPLKTRAPTHYYGGKGSVLDYILLSREFDANYQGSLYQLSYYHTYDRHLINPIFEHDGESTDHAVVLVTLQLRS